MSRLFNPSANGVDYIQVTRTADIEGFSSLTVASWAYMTISNSGPGGRIVTKNQGGTGDDYSLLQTPISGDPKWQLRINTSVGQTTITDTDVASTNTWYHLAGTWQTSDGAMELFVDGSSKVTGTQTGTLDDSNEDLTIGRHLSSAGRDFSGRVCECAIWNRVLSDNEINTVYRFGVMRSPVGLVFYMPLFGDVSPDYTLEGLDYTTSITGTPAQADHAPTGPQFSFTGYRHTLVPVPQTPSWFQDIEYPIANYEEVIHG